jgi:hypothetical protein
MLDVHQPTHPPTCNLNPSDGRRGIVQVQPIVLMSHLTLVLAHMNGRWWDSVRRIVGAARARRARVASVGGIQ